MLHEARGEAREEGQRAADEGDGRRSGGRSGELAPIRGRDLGRDLRSRRAPADDHDPNPGPGREVRRIGFGPTERARQTHGRR